MTPDHERLRAEAIAFFCGRIKPFTEAEVEEFFGVSRYTLLRWRRDGLKAFRKGGVVRYPVEEVYRFYVSQIV